MAILLSIQDLAKSYGARPLFEGLSFGLSDGERAGLIGPNGSGKSTLLRVLSGDEEPDRGKVVARRGLRLGFLAQKDGFAGCPDGAVDVLQGVIGQGRLDEAECRRRALAALDAAGFSNPEASAGSLSGGWRKRLAILCAACAEPDFLMLDEPTNHMDLDGVLWLERYLARWKSGLLMVTHDRVFLERVCDRVIEINKGYPEGFFSVNGSYSRFLEKREELFSAQAVRQAGLANQVRGEIEWLRRGPKARGTKQQARIDRAGGLMEELSDLSWRNAQARPVALDFSAGERQSRRLIELFGVTKAMGGRGLFGPLDLRLGPGSKLGLLGSNGSGKTTLLKILAGTLEPDSGSVKRADALNVVTFDQHRETLDPAWTLRRALGDGNETVTFQGRSVHVVGWADRFLFDRGHLDRPLGSFSGGEQARVLIARLMLRPADLLLLDEPTNDLDLETLRVLEESLREFSGAVVLVTHDRWLLESVSRRLLALDGRGNAEIYADLAQWENARAAEPPPGRAGRAGKTSDTGGTDPGSVARRNLSTRERRELDQMEASVLSADEAVKAAEEALADPSVAADAGELAARQRTLEAARKTVDDLYGRWVFLESKSKG